MMSTSTLKTKENETKYKKEKISQMSLRESGKTIIS